MFKGERSLGEQGDWKGKKKVLSRFHLLTAVEKSFLKQKSEMKWLFLGDRYTSYFFRLLKQRENRNTIGVPKKDDELEVADYDGLKQTVIEFLRKHLVETKEDVFCGDRLNSILRRCVNQEAWSGLTEPFLRGGD